jgi:hypothetical protein
MGIHWARREFAALDRLFMSAVLRMMLVCISGFAGLLLAVHLIREIKPEYAARLLSPGLLWKVMFVQACNIIIWAESLYLRANKQEPFVWVALAQGVLAVAVSLYLAKLFGLDEMLWGQVAVTFLALLVCTAVCLGCRRIWQSDKTHRQSTRKA